MAPRVRLLSGAVVDEEAMRGARSLSQVRCQAAAALGVPPSRLELQDAATGRLMTDTAWDVITEGQELVAIVSPPHALQLQRGRIQEAEDAVRHLGATGSMAKRSAAAPVDLGAIGEPPHTAFHVVPVCASAGLRPEGFQGLLSKAAPAGLLRERMAAALEVPSEAVGLSFGGVSLEDARSLVGNGIPELGAVARRNGGRVSLALALSGNVLPGSVSRAVSEQVMRQGEAEWRLFIARYLEGAEAPVQREDAARAAFAAEKPTWWVHWPAPGDAERFVAPEGVRLAMQQLVDRTWIHLGEAPGRYPGEASWRPHGRRLKGLKVEVVLHNESRKLWDAYCAARSELVSAEISPSSAATSEPDGGHLSAHVGEVDSGLNEFLLFRGIEPSDAGCLLHGMEVPETGLSFSDISSQADERANWEYIGDVHGAIHTMLLCRVVCGNQLVARADELKLLFLDWVKATLAASPRLYHSVITRKRRRGTIGQDLILFNADQVYPEFLICYRQVFEEGCGQ